ncbi:hypothetical protein KEM54_003984 [Ascosphaera aggregata]|nr:hypothetical protein KEM54_003984 [Ascosphaera aggregata]
METQQKSHKRMNRKRSQYRQGYVPKRTKVVDADGWTHVVVMNSQLRESHHKGFDRKPSSSAAFLGRADVFVPAEAPDGLTFDQLSSKFQAHLERWKDSDAWKQLQETLKSEQLRDLKVKIEQCVCIGLGSPSGLLRGGMVDRRAVSMYQLAALVSLLHNLNRDAPAVSDLDAKSDAEFPASSNPIKCYAQDPVFNELDIKLLESLGITVLTDTAFTLVDRTTFLYAPGAERAQLALLLEKCPPLFFGGPLSDLSSVTSSVERAAEAKAIDTYAAKSSAMRMPGFEPSESAFWKMGLFWLFNDDEQRNRDRT